MTATERANDTALPKCPNDPQLEKAIYELSMMAKGVDHLLNFCAEAEDIDVIARIYVEKLAVAAESLNEQYQHATLTGRTTQ